MFLLLIIQTALSLVEDAPNGFVTSSAVNSLLHRVVKVIKCAYMCMCGRGIKRDRVRDCIIVYCMITFLPEFVIVLLFLYFNMFKFQTVSR